MSVTPRLYMDGFCENGVEKQKKKKALIFLGNVIEKNV